MRKKIKLISDSGDSGSKICIRGCVGACGGIQYRLRLAEVWSQAIGFVLVRLASVTVKIFDI
jgi:hypothetical protein